MSLIKISWSGELTPERSKALNELGDVMYYSQVLQSDEFSAEEKIEAQEWLDNFEAKYGS